MCSTYGYYDIFNDVSRLRFDGLALAAMSPQRFRAIAPVAIAEQARKSLLAMFLLMGMVSMGWVPRIPEIKDAIGLTNGQFGFILLASTFGSVSGHTKPLLGYCPSL